MFTRTSRADRARAQVLDVTSSASHQLREKVAPVVAVAARDAKVWATPHMERGIEVAAPRVEAAVERVSPAVDAARDKIVEDLLPRLVEAVNAAATAGAAATAVTAATTTTARKRGKDVLAVARGEAVAKPKRKGHTWLLVLTGLAAAAGAAFAVFKRQAPSDDPWAVPPTTYPTSGTSTSASSSVSTDSSSASSTGAGTDSGIGSTSAVGGSEGAALSSGDAGDALDGGASIADADVPGLTVDSAAAKEAVTQQSDGDAQGADPLTDPIEKVHQASLRAEDKDADSTS